MASIYSLERSPKFAENLTPAEVAIVYERINPVPRVDVLRMISFYPNWRFKNMGPDELGKLVWYLDTDREHISWKLSSNGRLRTVRDIALAYNSYDSDKVNNKWGGSQKIEDMVAKIKNGGQLNPIIVVSGSRYKDSPESSFIDGVHRSLAVAVYNLRNPQTPVEINSYVGQKADFIERLSRKLK